MMPVTDFTIPFLTVALAELGDKSQILVFLLSSKTKKHFSLLLGVMAGFFVVDGLAILIGSRVVDVIPSFWLKAVTGTVFIVLGVLMLTNKEKDEGKNTHLKNPLVTGFTMIFMAEWGDKTQIASALFATKYEPMAVFVAVIAALLLLSVSAIYLGKIFADKIDKRLTTKIAGVLFMIIGLSSFIY